MNIDTDKITTLASANYQFLILGGGLISFIALFLPFLGVTAFVYPKHEALDGFSIYLTDTGLFLIYIILLIALCLGFFLGYNGQYPSLSLAIGVLLLLLTLYSSQQFSGEVATNFASGFFLEVIGSLAIAVGGYYFYQNNGLKTEKEV